MAKKSIIEREKKRCKLSKKYLHLRLSLKLKIKNAASFDEKLKFNRLLQKLPNNSSPTRKNNRCVFTGRSKGFYRYFGLSRHLLREMAHEGFLPGVVKASW